MHSLFVNVNFYLMDQNFSRGFKTTFEEFLFDYKKNYF